MQLKHAAERPSRERWKVCLLITSVLDFKVSQQYWHLSDQFFLLAHSLVWTKLINQQLTGGVSNAFC